MTKDEYAIEFPKRKKGWFETFFDLCIDGGKSDTVDGEKDEEDAMKHEQEWETTMEVQIEKLLVAKMEKLQSTVQLELKENFVIMNDKLNKDVEKKKQIENKIDKILEKLTTQ